jgi:hypothetical protein
LRLGEPAGVAVAALFVRVPLTHASLTRTLAASPRWGEGRRSEGA